MNWTTIENAIFEWIVASSGLAEAQVIHEKQGIQRPTPPYIGLRLALAKKGQDWINTVDNILSLSDDDVDTVDFANNELDLAAHAYESGDGPLQLTTTDTLPTGLALLTNYWAIKKDDGTIQLASTFANAVAAVPTAVAFSDVGVGTHTISATATTTRAGAEIKHTVRGTRRLTISIQCYGADATEAVRPSAILNDVMTKALFPSIADPLDTAGIGLAIFSEIQEFDVPLGSTTEPRGLLTVTAHLAEEVSEDGTYIETADAEEDPPFS